MSRRYKCISYNYWYDLKTDLRWPRSWLDIINMILRRVRLVLVRVEGEGKPGWYYLAGWPTFLDNVHDAGNCHICQEH